MGYVVSPAFPGVCRRVPGCTPWTTTCGVLYRYHAVEYNMERFVSVSFPWCNKWVVMVAVHEILHGAGHGLLNA